MRRGIDGAVLDGRARRVGPEVVVVPPVSGRADRAGGEAAAAVGAHIEENALHAIGAERALIGADVRRGRGRRQGDIAVLASGAEFEHAGKQTRETDSIES